MAKKAAKPAAKAAAKTEVKPKAKAKSPAEKAVKEVAAKKAAKPKKEPTVVPAEDLDEALGASEDGAEEAVKAPKAAKAPKAEKVKKPRAPKKAAVLDVSVGSDHHNKWSELKEKHSKDKAVAYTMSATYESNQPIQHKSLGWGLILNNNNDRLEVLFESGIKMLISNYKQ